MPPEFSVSEPLACFLLLAIGLVVGCLVLAMALLAALGRVAGA